MPNFTMTSTRRTLSTYRSHLVSTCLTVTGVFATVISLSVFVPLAAHLSRAPIGEEVSAGLAEHVLFLHAALWPIILFSLVACIASALILFGRMRSPLIRFVRCFNAIEEGSVPKPIVLRLSDYLNDEADALNRMIESLAETASARHRAARRIDAIVDDLSAQQVDPILLEELIGLVKTGLHSSERSAHDGS